VRRARWKEAVVYQIYVRSFMDGNGDGVGDLRGILSQVDYLQTLGVTAVWLTPIYPSPDIDNGYDVADYRAIDPRYGGFSDWEALRDALHARGMRLIMDIVVNHTSDQHRWFQSSRSSRSDPLRDYYIWRPPRDGGPPNNWGSAFGGPAWTFDENTGEYYLHIFAPEQPDLNWENPLVRNEMYDIMEWWLDHDADGFRMDVVNMISKEPGLPDAPVTRDGPWQWGGQYFLQGPRLLEYLREMNEQVLSRYDIMTVGEAPGITTEHAVDILHESGGPLNMLFHFEHVDIGSGELGKWTRSPWMLHQLKHVITRWEKELEDKGWNSFYLSNHDQPRAVSRFGDDGQYRERAAKLLATFLLMLQGTPYIYQGDEIGMTNVRFPDLSSYRDIETLQFHDEATRLRGWSSAEAMAAIYATSRDNARTPMQWTAEEHGGFTTGTPWIRANPNYERINVEAALADPQSVFHHYRRLIELRRDNAVVVYGRYDLLAEAHDQVYAFTRTLGDEKLLVTLNFSGSEATFSAPSELDCSGANLLISNCDVGASVAEHQQLQPWEARVYRIAGVVSTPAEHTNGIVTHGGP
jgi:oligo-1,6-glucosidase